MNMSRSWVIQALVNSHSVCQLLDFRLSMLWPRNTNRQHRREKVKNQKSRIRSTRECVTYQVSILCLFDKTRLEMTKSCKRIKMHKLRNFSDLYKVLNVWENLPLSSRQNHRKEGAHYHFHPCRPDTDIFANSADPDDQDLYCLWFRSLYFTDIPFLQQWMFPNSKIEEFIAETQWWKKRGWNLHIAWSKSVHCCTYISGIRKFIGPTVSVMIVRML